jgi:hypothetical protein
MQNFLLRAEDKLGLSFEHISEIYHRHKYRNNTQDGHLEELKKEIKTIKSVLKKR